MLATRYQELTKDLALSFDSLLANPTPEAVHRFRVGVRRTQAILSIFPKELGSGFSDSLKSTLKATSPLRDLDTMALTLQPFSSSHAPQVSKLTGRRASVVTKMSTELETIRPLKAPKLPLGFADSKKLTKKLRARIHERAETSWELLGEVSQSEGKVDKLHRLRLEVKKLRYLLELTDGTEQERETLSGWQDLLGMAHDYDNAMAHLGRGKASKKAVDELSKSRHATYRRFVRLSVTAKSKSVTKEIIRRA